MSNDFSLECICCDEEVFEINFTHNLTDMASEVKLKCGLTLYKLLWKPRGLAEDNLPLFEESLKILREKPEYFKKWNPKNKWGSYEDLTDRVLMKVIEACKKYPRTILHAHC